MLSETETGKAYHIKKDIHVMVHTKIIESITKIIESITKYSSHDIGYMKLIPALNYKHAYHNYHQAILIPTIWAQLHILLFY